MAVSTPGGDMDEVLEGLYLGSESAVEPALLRSRGITHILTLCHRPIAAYLHSEFRYLYIQARDTEDADLLTRFAECFRFIQEGRETGGVMVHCIAGMSRSATVVTAYVMSSTQHRGLKAALDFVTSKRPCVRPNPGFMEQLRLFEAMGSEINPRHPHYVSYRVQTLALKVQRGAKVQDVLEDLLEDRSEQGDQETSGLTSFYKCRKCRRPLFRSSGILTHAAGAGDAAFDWRSHRPPPKAKTPNSVGSEEQCQRSLFIEPVGWMKDDILSMDGKISCPKCSAKLGSFNWFGERCPCGTWVTPAFHIQTGKVDRCKR